MYDDESEHHKEVYARFGLAVYFAQVLEHALVNALVIIDLVPSQRHVARSQDEWSATLEAFYSRHFETTMGRMMKSLREVTEVPEDLDDLLRDALRLRNRLAHHYFRDNATTWATRAGRDAMLADLETCRSLFETADHRLDQIVDPLRRSIGISDELLAKAAAALLAEPKTV